MILKVRHKLPSGALQFTVFISVVIALILAGVLLLAYTHRFFMEQSKAILDTIKLGDSGIEYLKGQELIQPDSTLLVIPDAREGQIVQTNLSQWGIFEKAYVKSTHRKKQFIKCALLGTKMLATERPSLYLKETFNPLAVVGNTKINGIAVLPAQGVRPGNITGHSYYGKELIYGDIKKSDTLLPKLKHAYKDNLKYYLYTYEPLNNSAVIPFKENTSIINSFSASTKGYFSNTTIVLENIAINGNIIIRSLEQIIVRRTALLHDIILSAPVIIIEDDVKGNFQAIADTTIRVGKNCQLSYPSALVMLEKENAMDQSYDEFKNRIAIDTGSIIRGSICYFDTQFHERDFRANIVLNSGTVLKGEVYCDGNLELKACSVFGTVIAKNMVTNEGGTTFVNHIYDVTIDSAKLPESFGGILLEKNPKTVMKWLY